MEARSERGAVASILCASREVLYAITTLFVMLAPSLALLTLHDDRTTPDEDSRTVTTGVIVLEETVFNRYGAAVDTKTGAMDGVAASALGYRQAVEFYGRTCEYGCEARCVVGKRQC